MHTTVGILYWFYWFYCLYFLRQVRVIYGKICNRHSHVFVVPLMAEGASSSEAKRLRVWTRL